MSDTRLLFLVAENAPGLPYLVVDEDGAIAARGRLAHGDIVPAMRTVLVVPGSAVLARWIALPSCTQAQAAAAARHLLKDEIAVPAETLHVAVSPVEENGLRLVCAVAREAMRDCLARVNEMGVTPDWVVPDHLLLPPSDGDAVLVAFRAGEAVVRGRNLAFSAEPELAWLLIGNRPMQPIERDEEVEALFASQAMTPAINLLQQEFAPGFGQRTGWKKFRRAAALAAAVLLSPALLWGAGIAKTAFAAHALEAHAGSLARTIPGAATAPDPILYVKGRLADLGSGDRLLHMTAALSQAIQRTKSVEVESLSYLSEGILRATLVNASADDIAALRAGLAPARIGIEADAASESNGRSLTTITLRRNP
jgi:general secretion pathway protein L